MTLLEEPKIFFIELASHFVLWNTATNIGNGCVFRRTTDAISIQTVAWAEKQKTASPHEVRLHDLYRESILQSGVRLVDTPTLSFYQKSANFVQSNPFKCIAAIGMPAVAYIYYGQGGKPGGPAESFQMRILHTRVFGQFAVICTLIGVMSLKEIMDRYGRYITEDDIEARIQEMESTRTTLMTRAEYQNSLRRSS